MNDSRDILSSREDAPEAPHLCSHSVLGKLEDPVAVYCPRDSHLHCRAGSGALPPTAPATTASLAATTPTITAASIPSGILTECALAALSTRLGQQCEERAKDRHHIEELSQQLTETSYQLAYIKKVLDCLILGQTLAPTAAAVTHASSTPSGPVPIQGYPVAFHQGRPHHSQA